MQDVTAKQFYRYINRVQPGLIRVIALVVALAAFAVSHPLGEVIGSWPAVLAVALVTGLVVWGLALRRASA